MMMIIITVCVFCVSAEDGEWVS